VTLTVLAPLRLEAFAVRRGLRDPASRVVRSGMGPVRARAAAGRSYVGPVAVAGVCGGVEPRLRPGNVVVATALRTTDGRERALDGAEVVADAVRRLGLACVTGAILSVERLERTAVDAASGHEGVVAVDMESAWLSAAAGDGLFVVLRVVADAGGRSVYHPRTLVDGVKALASLRRAAPALEAWAEALDPPRPAGPRTIGLTARAIEFNLQKEVM
jgi:4-hydroxy-3-methylbut-2-en-1-yl diphosphate reductase